MYFFQPGTQGIAAYPQHPCSLDLVIATFFHGHEPKFSGFQTRASAQWMEIAQALPQNKEFTCSMDNGWKYACRLPFVHLDPDPMSFLSLEASPYHDPLKLPWNLPFL